MKSVICVLLAIVLVGCASWMVDPETGESTIPPEVAEFGVNTAGFTAGILVAKLPPWVDTSLRNVYTLATSGKLDIESMNQLISTFESADDIVIKAMANRLLRLANMVGAIVVDGKIINIDELDPVLMKALADGYVEGYDLAKASASS
jgi:hypothetical protein